MYVCTPMYFCYFSYVCVCFNALMPTLILILILILILTLVLTPTILLAGGPVRGSGALCARAGLRAAADHHLSGAGAGAHT